MADQNLTRVDVAQEIAAAIVHTAKNLTEYPDSVKASAALKDLAEAAAWLNSPSQPH